VEVFSSQEAKKEKKSRYATKPVQKEPTVVFKGLRFSLILKKRRYDNLYELRRINQADPEALEREKQRKYNAEQRALWREKKLREEEEGAEPDEQTYLKKAKIVLDRSSTNQFGFVSGGSAAK